MGWIRSRTRRIGAGYGSPFRRRDSGSPGSARRPGRRYGIIEAWDDFHQSEAWNAVYEETYTSTFYDAALKRD